MSSTTINPNQHYPRWVADIGGTNARFALETAHQVFEKIEVLPCKNYETIVDAAQDYLQRVGNPPVKHAAMAIANPVVGDYLQMTNHHWAFSIEAMRQALGLETLLFINDFTAQALAITQESPEHFIQIGGGQITENAPKAVLGAGTGLGVSGLIPSPTGYVALSGEGGHVSFAPFNETETQIWQYAQQKFGHVSAERFLSGAGLELIYEALSHLKNNQDFQALSAADITERAQNRTDAFCRETLDIFCAIFGTIASNLALTLGARGGVYLCGGIVPRFVDDFKQSPFRQRFEDKGRFRNYLAEIPVFVVSSAYPGLMGSAVALENHLNTGV